MKNVEEKFQYDSQNRLTEVRLGTTLTGASSYDSYGRMTAKTADGQAVFSNAVYSTTAKPHALDAATTFSGVFPVDPQTITYTGFDKVSKVKQGNDSLCYTYGYDHQRIRMEEHIGSSVRTKQYVGSCEYITETGTSGTRSFTYLTGPCGVFAVIEKHNGVEDIHYILKDNLGSWTTITNSSGTVEQQLSYDAWGNLRNPNTWANYTLNDIIEKPMFDRGFTGHEHLCHFSLINMNGRMYDPVTSSFLSADRYVQDPTSAMGFNRYAYCMYNPLSFVDPTGWLSGGGGNGNGDHPPGELYYVNGMPTVNLPEVTITDSPIFNNEFVYTPYMDGGGITNPCINSSNGQSIGSSNGGGGGSGNQGVSTTLNNLIIPAKDSNYRHVLIKKQIKTTYEVNYYINSTNTLLDEAVRLTQSTTNVSKEVGATIVLSKVSRISKMTGIVGFGINLTCIGIQVQQDIIPWQEGIVRGSMSGIEFGLAFIPYVGPILSISLTAYDIGGGFDNNLYNTEKWWKRTTL